MDFSWLLIHQKSKANLHQGHLPFAFDPKGNQSQPSQGDFLA
jgi:hypothetical protein